VRQNHAEGTQSLRFRPYVVVVAVLGRADASARLDASNKAWPGGVRPSDKGQKRGVENERYPMENPQMVDAPEDGFQQRLKNALESPEVPVLYVNGFVNSMTSGDVLTVLERNGRPVAVLNMSFTVAKTLSVGLGSTIAQLEEGAGQSMLTTQEVGKALERGEKK
jgi:hypothetical protein